MLQHSSGFRSESVAASLVRGEVDLRPDIEFSARMNGTRCLSSNNKHSTTALSCLSGEGEKHTGDIDIGMPVDTEYQAHRTNGFRRHRDSSFLADEDVESRCSKRSEITPLIEQQHYSGESDLTAEQAAVSVMAAKSSSTGSDLEEVGCHLKLRYGSYCYDKEDVDENDEGCNDSHRATPSSIRMPDDGGSDDQNDEDWLELRLGSCKFSNGNSPSMSSSSSASLCTLQLLPQKPDCATVRERELRNLSTTGHEQNQEEAKGNLLLIRKSQIDRHERLLQEGSLHNGKENHDTLMQPLSYTAFLQSPSAPIHCRPGTAGINFEYPAGYGSASEINNAFELYSQRNAQLHRNTSLPLLDNRSLSAFSQTSQAPAATPIMMARTPLDYGIDSWQQLVSGSTPNLANPIATSFQDLIASTFSNSPGQINDVQQCTSVEPLTTLAPQLSKTLDDRWLSSINTLQRSQSLKQHSQQPNVPNRSANVIPLPDFDPLIISDSRSMTSWLSQTLVSSGVAATPPPIGRTVSRSLQVNGRSESPEISTPTPVSCKPMPESDNNNRTSSLNSNIKLLEKPACRSITGMWFALQPQPGSDSDDSSSDTPKLYVRIKNEDMPILAVKKYVATKLGLSNESQVELMCRGKCLAEDLSLRSVRDEVWVSHSFAEKKALNFRTDKGTNEILKECVLILSYQISQISS